MWMWFTIQIFFIDVKVLSFNFLYTLEATLRFWFLVIFQTWCSILFLFYDLGKVILGHFWRKCSMIKTTVLVPPVILIIIIHKHLAHIKIV